jgi:DNA-binding transcriptional LysR family regulator
MLVTSDTNNWRNMEFQDLRLFVSVVDNGSFTRAAEQEDLPTSTLSRRLRKLEDELGLRLLERTTRRVQVTELGAEFYERCLQILEDVDSTRASLKRKQETPSGRLRVYAPTEFTRVHFQDVIPSFAERYPDITLELFTSDGGHNLVDTRVDVMVHIEEPQDSSYIGKKLTVATTNYYASSDYLEKFGEPQYPQDLLQHECILEAFNPHDYQRWLFPDGDQSEEIAVQSRYVTDSTYMALRLVERGLGVSMLPDYICREGLEAGRLQKLFEGRYEISHNIYLLYPSRRYVPSKVRVFLDFLEEQFPKQL